MTFPPTWVFLYTPHSSVSDVFFSLLSHSSLLSSPITCSTDLTRYFKKHLRPLNVGPSCPLIFTSLSYFPCKKGWSGKRSMGSRAMYLRVSSTIAAVWPRANHLVSLFPHLKNENKTAPNYSIFCICWKCFISKKINSHITYSLKICSSPY